MAKKKLEPNGDEVMEKMRPQETQEETADTGEPSGTEEGVLPESPAEDATGTPAEESGQWPDEMPFPPVQDVSKSAPAEPEEAPAEDVPTQATEDTGSPAPPIPREARQRRRPTGENSVLTVEGDMERIAAAEIADEETEIYASRVSHKPITVRISQVIGGDTTDESAMPRVICMYGSYKLLVPFEEMNIALSPSENGDELRVRSRKVLLSMIGAEIDVIIRGIDHENRIAAASRRQAMLFKQRTILNATDARGNYRVSEGMNCEARVIAVVPQMARLEMFGVEVRLPATEYRWEYIGDLTTELFPGDRIVVKIMRLEREDGRVSKMRVSRRETLQNLQIQNVKLLQVGARCGGLVENFAKGMYFVKLQDIEAVVGCVISANYTFISPRRGDFVMVLIREIDHESGRVSGAITRIIKSQHRK